MTPRSFFSLPTLGGWLTILHCTCVLLAFNSPLFSHGPRLLIRGLACILAFPLKAGFLGGRHLFPPEDLPLFAVAAALDSFLWGYGLAGIWRLLVRWKKNRFQFSVMSALVIATMLALGLAIARYLKL